MGEPDLLHKLFDTVKSFVIASGGDGDGFIISPRYKELADLFEAYEKDNGAWFTERDDSRTGSIVFSNWQEAIIFTNAEDRLLELGSDIIVKIY